MIIVLMGTHFAQRKISLTSKERERRYVGSVLLKMSNAFLLASIVILVVIYLMIALWCKRGLGFWCLNLLLCSSPNSSPYSENFQAHYFIITYFIQESKLVEVQGN
jgi:hypothetical protein